MEIIGLAMRAVVDERQLWNFNVISGKPLDRIRAGNEKRRAEFPLVIT